MPSIWSVGVRRSPVRSQPGPWSAPRRPSAIGEPAGNCSSVPAATSCRPGCQTRPVRPDPVDRAVDAPVHRLGSLQDDVRVDGDGRRVRGSRGRRRAQGCGCRERNRPSTKTAGTTSAVSFSQNWNACTNVIDRMPPPTTVSTTTSPAPAMPLQAGRAGQRGQRQPGALELGQQVEPPDDRARRPCTAGAGRREFRRATAKSGTVYAPGAAQRRADEEHQRQVAGGERDGEPQGVRAVAQDHPGDPEERRRRQVLPGDRARVGDRADGARGDEEVRRAPPATRTPIEPMTADATPTSVIATSATMPEVVMRLSSVLDVVGEVLLDAVGDPGVAPTRHRPGTGTRAGRAAATAPAGPGTWNRPTSGSSTRTAGSEPRTKHGEHGEPQRHLELRRSGPGAAARRRRCPPGPP